MVIVFFLRSRSRTQSASSAAAPLHRYTVRTTCARVRASLVFSPGADRAAASRRVLTSIK